MRRLMRIPVQEGYRRPCEEDLRPDRLPALRSSSTEEANVTLRLLFKKPR